MAYRTCNVIKKKTKQKPKYNKTRTARKQGKQQCQKGKLMSMIDSNLTPFAEHFYRLAKQCYKVYQFMDLHQCHLSMSFFWH